jgi:hypothetical protein
MVILSDSTEISFRSIVYFDGSNVDLTIEHKATKTLVENLGITPSIVDTLITLQLPDLSSIFAVANIMDELCIRVYQDGVLLFEYLAYYCSTDINIYKQWKDWDTTALNSKKWVTL